MRPGYDTNAFGLHMGMAEDNSIVVEFDAARVEHDRLLSIWQALVGSTSKMRVDLQSTRGNDFYVLFFERFLSSKALLAHRNSLHQSNTRRVRFSQVSIMVDVIDLLSTHLLNKASCRRTEPTD